MWMPNDIEQDFSNFTLDNIKFLEENNIREGLHLEYKEQYTKNIRKTICAYLNTDGGWLIIGIKEGDEKIQSINGVSEDFIEEFHKCFSQFDPFVDWDFDQNFKAIPLEDEKFVYIIRVPRSNHSIKINGLYFIRIGAQTIKLTKDSDIIILKKNKGELDALGREIRRYRKIPNKDYSNFIGRKSIYNNLITELKKHHIIVSIDGIGGVGKSTLALELAHNIFNQRIFDSVLWFSAKKERFIFSQITSIEPEFNNLEDLLERIAYELEIRNYNKFSIENKVNVIIEMLKKHSILLIIDNLETIDLNEQFINFLAKVEGKSKVLITSRKRIGQLERILNLEAFTIENSIEFINQEAEARSLIIPEPIDEIFSSLYKLTEGIPLAIKVLMGWLVNGVPIIKLREKLESSDEGILEFCFKETYDNQLSENSKILFCIFSFLPNGITNEILENCTDFNSDDLEEAVSELINYSLIIRTVSTNEDMEDYDTYKMLPLTRVFAYKKSGDFKNLERRTLKEYNSFIEKKDQYRNDLRALAPEFKLAGLNQKQKNAYLKALKGVELFENGDYPNATKLFREADRITDDVPEVYYMWGNVEMKIGHLRMTDELFEKATKLNPENPSYWLTWAGFHRQNKNETKAKKILFESLDYVDPNKQYILRRELGIVLCYQDEYNRSLKILKDNLINSPLKENEFIMNTKTMGSILHTYIIQAKHRSHEKQYESAKKRLFDAKNFYKNNNTIINVDNPGIIWRRKRINLELAKRYVHTDFELANKYFNKAYYKNPESKREKEHNSAYFLRDWQYFVNLWVKRGKEKSEFIDIFEKDPKNERFKFIKPRSKNKERR